MSEFHFGVAAQSYCSCRWNWNWGAAREFEIDESIIHYWWKKKMSWQNCLNANAPALLASPNFLVIPESFTKNLQPIDISVNGSFKNHVREEWQKSMSEGIHTFAKTGKIRRATHAEAHNWVIQAWKAVKVMPITNVFRKARITSIPYILL